MRNFLFKQIDNSALIVYRICFGILISLEAFGAILTGWVNYTLIEPKFTFNFIGFDFLQPLGKGMYLYFIIMGILGIFVTIGYRFKASILAFSIMWTCVYLMQKTSYNNHYYLFALLSWILVFLPANTYKSVDVKRNPSLYSTSMPNWCKWFIIVHLFIVYTYASIAKMYPDWLDLTVAKNLFIGKADWPIVGSIFQQKWFHYFIAYSGILFDLLIVPLLVWKRTRLLGFAMAVFFHLFNSFVFHIGIFPYLAIVLCIFFFDERVIHRIFLKNKPFYEGNEVVIPKQAKAITFCIATYLIIQALLPLRHHLIKGDVLWTEEGHRLSWRMMLRGKTGYVKFKIINKKTGETSIVNQREYLSKKQQKRIPTHPDFIWQFAQRLKREHAKKGEEIEVYAIGKVSVNGGKYQTLIDPAVDLANVKWDYLWHNDWILLASEGVNAPKPAFEPKK